MKIKNFFKQNHLKTPEKLHKKLVQKVNFYRYLKKAFSVLGHLVQTGACGAWSCSDFTAWLDPG